MFRRILKAAAISLLGLALAGGVLYQFFGLRAVLDGGGTPYLSFVKSPEAQAEEIARHRQAQGPQTEAVGPAVQPEAPIVAPAAADDPPPAASGEAVASATSLTAEPAPYWTAFRGPARDGHYRERPIVTAWPARGLTPIWKQPVGGGYASFAIARGRAFTIEQRAEQEVVAAYDVRTGRELWTNAWPAFFREFMGGDGPRATPTWADGRVYALGAEGEFRALDDGTGRVLWRKNILEDNGATNLQWGMAASPLVVGDTVIVLPGGRNGKSVVAYDRRSGERVWSALDDQQAYVAPMLATLSGVPQILVFSASRLMGLTPDRGEVLWEYPWRTQYEINAAQPLVVGPNRVFLSSGYGSGAAVIEVVSGGAGFGVTEVWRNNRMKNRFAASVLHDGFIYGFDESIFACMDVATGELKWKGGRYGYGQVLLAEGHLIVLTEEGELALLRATPERHEELVRFPVVEGKTWNPPAIADGYLLVRNLAEMAAFNLQVPAK
ncbi:MAG: PQQ-like beta-propeller repeat protein [Acidobacteria bacterium]|nr:PQQ-like beta-propeller repeat protein [Acidobacteriota bacterium]